MKHSIACIAVALLPSVLSNGQDFDARSFDWEAANRSVVRLAPDRFPQLPATLRSYLKQAQFTIPQAYELGQPHNVIAGDFRSQRITDWAVLASRDRVSRILVFWSGSPRKVASIAEAADVGFLQHMGGGVAGFSRVIRTARVKTILSYRKTFGDRPIPIEHDGIEDAF
ncbi:MAG TPA: hypothetical protein VE078_11595, partial [Thermoanaerobaculia bacterium]|nr:hypothetical protein [Thermoanaerobaculia bacterium]